MDLSIFPQDLINEILCRTNARTVSKVASTCKDLRVATKHDRIWERLFHSECRRRDAYAAGFVNTSQFVVAATWREKYQKWCAFLRQMWL
jgi:hypothetical protein